MLSIVATLLSDWKLLTALPMGLALLVALYSLTLPAVYEASATFFPETRLEQRSVSAPSGLAQLANQLGFATNAATAATQLYTTVLASRSLQEQVLETGFPDPRTTAPDDSAALIDLLDIPGDTRAERLDNGRERLANSVTVTVDAANVIGVSFRHTSPALAANVANAIVRLVNRFNTETRQSNARELRQFVERQLVTSEAELLAAEDALKTFLERNREFQGAPELEFEADRLRRQVTVEQDVFLTLRRQYEEIRIQEVNDTPVITVLDPAVPPQRRYSPRRRRMVLLAFFLGIVLASILALSRRYLRRARAQRDEDFRDIETTWSEVKQEVGSALGRVWRSGRG